MITDYMVIEKHSNIYRNVQLVIMLAFNTFCYVGQVYIHDVLLQLVCSVWPSIRFLQQIIIVYRQPKIVDH